MTIVSKRFACGFVGGMGSSSSSTLFEGLPRGMGSFTAAFAVRLRGGMGSRRLAADSLQTRGFGFRGATRRVCDAAQCTREAEASGASQRLTGDAQGPR